MSIFGEAFEGIRRGIAKYGSVKNSEETCPECGVDLSKESHRKACALLENASPRMVECATCSHLGDLHGDGPGYRGPAITRCHAEGCKCEEFVRGGRKNTTFEEARDLRPGQKIVFKDGTKGTLVRLFSGFDRWVVLCEDGVERTASPGNFELANTKKPKSYREYEYEFTKAGAQIADEYGEHIGTYPGVATDSQVRAIIDKHIAGRIADGDAGAKALKNSHKYQCSQCPFSTSDPRAAAAHESSENPETGGHTMLENAAPLSPKLKWDADEGDFRVNLLDDAGMPITFADRAWHELRPNEQDKLAVAFNAGLNNADSSSLGYQQTMKTTTAKREDLENYGTSEMEEELREYVRRATGKTGKLDQGTAKRVAADLIADNRSSDLGRYIRDAIGNEFDLQHYLENSLEDFREEWDAASPATRAMILKKHGAPSMVQWASGSWDSLPVEGREAFRKAWAPSVHANSSPIKIGDWVVCPNGRGGRVINMTEWEAVVEPTNGAPAPWKWKTSELKKMGENSSWLSRCEACGHLSTEEWGGKCEGCGAKYDGEPNGDFISKESSLTNSPSYPGDREDGPKSFEAFWEHSDAKTRTQWLKDAGYDNPGGSIAYKWSELPKDMRTKLSTLTNALKPGAKCADCGQRATNEIAGQSYCDACRRAWDKMAEEELGNAKVSREELYKEHLITYNVDGSVDISDEFGSHVKSFKQATPAEAKAWINLRLRANTAPKENAGGVCADCDACRHAWDEQAKSMVENGNLRECQLCGRQVEEFVKLRKAHLKGERPESFRYICAPCWQRGKDGGTIDNGLAPDYREPYGADMANADPCPKGDGKQPCNFFVADSRGRDKKCAACGRRERVENARFTCSGCGAEFKTWGEADEHRKKTGHHVQGLTTVGNASCPCGHERFSHEAGKGLCKVVGCDCDGDVRNTTLLSSRCPSCRTRLEDKPEGPWCSMCEKTVPWDDMVNASNSECDECGKRNTWTDSVIIEQDGEQVRQNRCTKCCDKAKADGSFVRLNAVPRKFHFRDHQGEVIIILAPDETSAWENLAQEFGEDKETLKKVAQLFKVENASSDPECLCDHPKSSHAGEGKCLECHCSHFQEWSKMRNALSAPWACGECGKDLPTDEDVKAHKLDTGHSMYAGKQNARPGQLTEASTVKCPECGTKQNWGDMLSYGACKNKSCSFMVSDESVGLGMLIVNDGADAESIQRHAEGIEHELAELKEKDAAEPEAADPSHVSADQRDFDEISRHVEGIEHEVAELGNAAQIFVRIAGTPFVVEKVDSTHVRLSVAGTDKWGNPLHVQQLGPELIRQLKAEGAMSLEGYMNSSPEVGVKRGASKYGSSK